MFCSSLLRFSPDDTNTIIVKGKKLLSASSFPGSVFFSPLLSRSRGWEGGGGGRSKTLGNKVVLLVFMKYRLYHFSSAQNLFYIERYSEIKAEKHQRISNKPKMRTDYYHSGRLKQKQTIGKSLPLFKLAFSGVVNLWC